MANSKYEYVREFEQTDLLLPNTWIVVRIDGRGFHKLSTKYAFEKPNDRSALDLMNAAAVSVMKEFPDVILGYGDSDEYSFIFHKSTSLFQRRASKLSTTITSTFTAHYVYLWPTYFPMKPLSPPLPSFDGRCVLYPTTKDLRNYLAWRQADCHINNLYNTIFHTLVLRGNLSPQEAEAALSTTTASAKNEMLFQGFGINYNNEPEMYRKGSVVYRAYELAPVGVPVSGNLNPDDDDGAERASLSKTAAEKEKKIRSKARIAVEHVDIIKDDFWERRPWILSGKSGILPPTSEDAMMT
ncbi:tRNAHis guanylyltransferase [Aulographum hederae CBS 113979]|uniref:tRNA(His) guanylyltransferase n=1 Tax=Aulographum hederae CBS 113979 TaxID=1176131 RepID=A0A6G1H6G1_9PEZI|nr:tRNAHis guanylyltransferase [Aulographum hederae CBS 113979]